MSMCDPVSDLCTRIRNGQLARLAGVYVSRCKLNLAILNVLKEEGYVGDFKDGLNEPFEIFVTLRYYDSEPVVSKLSRVSKPGRRVYRSCKDLPFVLGGLGVAIISTSAGVMSDKHARLANRGGEVLCVVE